MRSICQLIAMLAWAVTGMAVGAEWGDLKARFVFDGALPAPRLVVANNAACGAQIVDESLVVNPSNHGIANVVVFLYVAKDGSPPSVHESYKESATASVTLDNTQCRFQPHVVAMRTTQTLLVGNKDPFGHNTNVTTLNNVAQNVLIPGNGQAKMNFPAVEILPSRVACNIHPWMSAYLVIKDHPYIGISDKDGHLQIKNLPTGKWTFQLWHETSGYVTESFVDGKKMGWTRGRAEIEIKKEGTDLKEIKLSPDLFKQN